MTSKPGPMLAEEQGMRMLNEEEEVILSVARPVLMEFGYEGIGICVTVGVMSQIALEWRG